MSKRRQVAFSKPEEPSFIKKLKREAGYKEGPTIDTKFEKPQIDDAEDLSEDESEKPQIVVLKSGDLTKEEAEAEEKRKKEEIDSERADLSKRIVFKPKKKNEDEFSGRSKEKVKIKSNPSLLSFDDDDDDDDELN